MLVPTLRPRPDAIRMERTLDPARLGDHLDRLYRAAWALSGSREDAEDLVQETYARVLAKPRLIRNEDDLGYLLRALRNTFFTRLKTERRRLRPGPLPEQLDLVADPHARDPEAAVEAGELYADRRATRRLSRRSSPSTSPGLSYKETARASGSARNRDEPPLPARQQVVRGSKRLGLAARRDRSDEHFLAGRRPVAVGPLTRRVSVEKSFGETPAQRVTLRPSLNVPMGTSTPCAFRSQAS
jgi:RNA polymerase sigma-70 factor (ECF subfamily)